MHYNVGDLIDATTRIGVVSEIEDDLYYVLWWSRSMNRYYTYAYTFNELHAFKPYQAVK